MKFNRCPCGIIPKNLVINCSERAKWGYVLGDCCGEWSIEFRNQYAKLGSVESEKAARHAWNNAPRSTDL
jgi:hypothetical protein